MNNKKESLYAKEWECHQEVIRLSDDISSMVKRNVDHALISELIFKSMRTVFDRGINQGVERSKDALDNLLIPQPL